MLGVGGLDAVVAELDARVRLPHPNPNPNPTPNPNH